MHNRRTADDMKAMISRSGAVLIPRGNFSSLLHEAAL